MQWTNGNGGAYGEDPYGDAGYAYAYGHEGYGHDGYADEGYGHEGYWGDTATLTWGPTQPVQWAQPHLTAWDTAGGPAWDAAHGDVLTVPAPETDTQPIAVVPLPSEPDPNTPQSEPALPVFVDSSGRRQRLVRRTARLLMIPAGGYVALLISTMLGGPGISAPFVPQAGTSHPAAPRVTASDSPSAPSSAGSVNSAAGHADSRPTAQRTSTPVRPTASTVPATAAPTRATSSTATASPTPTSSSRGRAIGTSHKPVK